MHQIEVNPLDFLILVVDDSKQNVVLLTHLLSKQGFRVESSVNGEEALKKIKEVNPDLILMDIMMPKMSGIEASQKIGGSQFKDIPIIFLSSSNETFDKVQAFESGGVDFLNKPFDKVELIMRVRNHLMLKLLREENEEKIKILREREEELTSANLKKHNLMRMLSHDIKNPISGITGLVSILLEDDSLEEHDIKEMLELIKTSSQKLLKIVKEQLDQEVEGDFQDLELSEVNIIDIAKEAIQINKSKAALKKIDIKFDTGGEEEILVSIDEKKIKQVFNTLIFNAVKFSLASGTVMIKLERQGDKHLLIKIIDSGLGIPNSMLPNFLISSERDQENNPKRISGIGFGLGEVRTYVEAHDGNIWVESKEGKGTTFFIELSMEK